MTSTAVTVKIDNDIKKRLKNLAQSKQRSAHWLMREAITQYVKREDKRESFREDAIRSRERLPGYRITCNSKRGTVYI